MKISCTSTMVPGDTLTEKAEHLKAWGYDGIAVFAEYSQWGEALHEEIRNLEERTGIRPCEFAFSHEIYGHLMDEDEEVREKCRVMYQIAAKVSGEIGAVTELEFAYAPQNPLPLFAPYAQMLPREKEQFLLMYREIAKETEGTEGSVLLEGINRYESPYLNSLRDCSDIVRELNHKNAGVLADFFHMAIEEADLAESIRYAAETIRHIHLGDSNRLLPGRGHTDWKSCFDALREIEYSGYLNLECSTCGNPETTLLEQAAFLKKLIQEGE